MPAQWSSLPLHSSFAATPLRDRIAVYTRSRLDKSLTYNGYICPPSPETLSRRALQIPPKDEGFSKKYSRLKEKIRGLEAETEAWKRLIQEDEASINQEPDVKAEPTSPGRAAPDYEVKQETEDFPLPPEVLEPLLPAPPERQTGEFLSSPDSPENPWDANPFNFSSYDLDPSAQLRPDQISQEDGEFLADIDLVLR
ncbi:hypothetical protein PBY51_002364 [Eleginops maclovinus]|uniref:Uncharacterized protein n=1 Tax=Eleginops maclovinus TaxID=56733 RepID=A0AAN7XCM0_ELEMC|nr:hypothetical protein PBY51_002364 [Eleginops maclovinus]